MGLLDMFKNKKSVEQQILDYYVVDAVAFDEEQKFTVGDLGRFLKTLTTVEVWLPQNKAHPPVARFVFHMTQIAEATQEKSAATIELIFLLDHSRRCAILGLINYNGNKMQSDLIVPFIRYIFEPLWKQYGQGKPTIEPLTIESYYSGRWGI
jgi:hypothetical protein